MNKLRAVLVILAALLAKRQDASADTVTLYTDLTSFQNALAGLGLTADLINFESLPNGTPVGAGDVFRPSPENFNLFDGANTATLQTGSGFVYEDFVSVSPSHSLRETSSGPTALGFGAPVAAVGVFALDIDNLIANAVTVVYRSITVSDVVQQFDNSGGSANAVAFLGAIATDDTLSVARNILSGATYNLSNVNTPEFTYLDDLRVAAVPEPSSLLLISIGMVTPVLIRCRRKSSAVGSTANLSIGAPGRSKTQAGKPPVEPEWSTA